jgi:hypothetical protein
MKLSEIIDSTPERVKIYLNAAQEKAQKHGDETWLSLGSSRHLVDTYSEGPWLDTVDLKILGTALSEIKYLEKSRNSDGDIQITREGEGVFCYKSPFDAWRDRDGGMPWLRKSWGEKE